MTVAVVVVVVGEEVKRNGQGCSQQQDYDDGKVVVEENGEGDDVFAHGGPFGGVAMVEKPMLSLG